jgi:Double zinc ribbon
MLFALFGIDDDVLNLVVNLLILSLVVVYFTLVAWTFFDARRRMDDPVLVAASVGASFVFPFIGTVIYSILRPPEFLEDAHERQIEIKAAELRVKQLSEQSCPKCEYPVEKNYLRCPNCRARLKDPCPSCGKPVDPRWALCPYCETVLEKPKPRPRPRPEPERAERREGPRPAPDARPSQARSGRGGRRAAAGAARGSSSKQTNRQAEGQRRKASSGSRRQPARTGSGETSEQRDDKQESGRPSGGEERPRPATAS